MVNSESKSIFVSCFYLFPSLGDAGWHQVPGVPPKLLGAPFSLDILWKGKGAKEGFGSLR